MIEDLKMNHNECVILNNIDARQRVLVEFYNNKN